MDSAEHKRALAAASAIYDHLHESPLSEAHVAATEALAGTNSVMTRQENLGAVDEWGRGHVHCCGLSRSRNRLSIFPPFSCSQTSTCWTRSRSSRRRCRCGCAWAAERVVAEVLVGRAFLPLASRSTVFCFWPSLSLLRPAPFQGLSSSRTSTKSTEKLRYRRHLTPRAVQIASRDLPI